MGDEEGGEVYYGGYPAGEMGGDCWPAILGKAHLPCSDLTTPGLADHAVSSRASIPLANKVRF
jgi:hypothetical protein